jgi:hypothetical protein
MVVDKRVELDRSIMIFLQCLVGKVRLGGTVHSWCREEGDGVYRRLQMSGIDFLLRNMNSILPTWLTIDQYMHRQCYLDNFFVDCQVGVGGRQQVKGKELRQDYVDPRRSSIRPLVDSRHDLSVDGLRLLFVYRCEEAH